MCQMPVLWLSKVQSVSDSHNCINLRGRVGRGADQSYCILMSSFKLSADAKVRLETMVKSSDGFEISEVDLKLRGPGNLMGTQQSGVLNLKIADIVKDTAILQKARNVAVEVLKR